MFFRVWVQGPGPGPGSRVRVQVLEVAVRDNTFFHCTRSFLCFFCCFLCLPFPLPKLRIFCVIILWVNGWKYENLLQINTSWLASLRTWYYFNISWEEPRIKVLFIFTKVLIKNENWQALVTVIGQFTTKTINSEKSYTFCLLCLIQ